MLAGLFDARSFTLLLTSTLCCCLSACADRDTADLDAHDAGDGIEDVDGISDAEELRDSLDGETESLPQCDPCEASSQCLSGVCAAVSEGVDVCLNRCEPGADACTAGYECLAVDEVGGALCVPVERSCSTPCLGVDCAPGTYCQPDTGSCEATSGLCEPCSSDFACEGADALCVQLGATAGSARCGSMCDQSSDCPADYECVDVGAGESLRQCVPQNRDCQDLCLGVDCGPAGFCNSQTGDCVPQLTTCANCSSDRQCGSQRARCAALPGPTCDSRADCVLPGASCVQGACEVQYCLNQCGVGETPCSTSERCTEVEEGLSLCVPITLACEDRCADVTCAVGEYCDPVKGTCETQSADYCQSGCELDVRCGFAVDGCGDLGDGESYCLPGCAPPDIICPAGYECSSSSSTRGICYPRVQTGCAACDGVECVSGTVCSPSTGQCEARPVMCSDDSQCRPGSRCARSAGRCVPDVEECTPGIESCTTGTGCIPVDSESSGGICEIRCEDPVTCSVNTSACVLFARSEGAICTAAGAREAENCAIPRRQTSDRGIPCAENADCATDMQCIPASASTDRSVCAAACSSDTDCAGSEECVNTDEGDFCVGTSCGCLNVPTTEQGLPYLLDFSLSLNGRNRCDIYRSRADIEAISSGTSAGSAAFKPAIVGRAMIDPLGAILDWASELGALFESPNPDLDGYALDRAELALTHSLAELRLPPLGSAGQNNRSESLVIEFSRVLDIAGAGSIADVDVTSLFALNTENQNALKELLFAYQFGMRMASEGLQQSAFGQNGVLTRSDLDALLDRNPAGLSIATLNRLSTGWLPQYPIAAASLMVTAVNRFRADVDDSDPALADLFVAAEGEFGWIIIAGTADDQHVYDGEILLSIDIGGDDTYVGNFAGIPDLGARPLSVAIDLSGSDRWTYREAWEANPAGGNYDEDADTLVSDQSGRDLDGRSASTALRQGGCVSGVAQLFDLGQGADSFETLRAGQGFGVLGVGMLVDSQGAARYSMESGGLGAGWLGVGISVTTHDGGDFEIEANGLGSSIGGVGVQFSGPGDDRYARPARIDHYAGDVVPHALLGAGVGGAELTSTLGIAGGAGVFIEPAGDDIYPEATLSFGAGRYAGAGGFVDRDGDDTFVAYRRAMGVGFEFGVGLFINGSGAESFGETSTPMRESMGSGQLGGSGVALIGGTVHDYVAGAHSLGAARAGGFALVADLKGNDIYQLLAATTLGFADSTLTSGASIPTFAIFLDGGGNDVWNGADVNEDGIDDNVLWNRCAVEENSSALCIGSDRTRDPIEWTLR